MDREEFIDAPNHPKDEALGTRKVPFSREILIERSDFMEQPSKKFYRLSPGNEVRLRYAYYITCNSMVKDEKSGEIKALHCTYDPKTKGGYSPDGRKVKSTLHWVSSPHAISAEIRLYDRLFTKENPSANGDFLKNLNLKSLEIKKGYIEPSLKQGKPGMRYQFERIGFFNIDPVDTKVNNLVFNRTITLKDTWSKK